MVEADKNNFELTDDQKQEIKEAYDLFDITNKGHIEVKELKVALRALDFEIEGNEFSSLMSRMNKTEDSSINYEEFKEIIAFKMIERDPIEEFRKNYKLLCGDENLITFDVLKKSVEDLSENMSNDEINEILSEVAIDNKLGITEEDFIRIMKQHSGLSLNNI